MISNMTYLNVSVSGLRGRHHPVLANMMTVHTKCRRADNIFREKLTNQVDLPTAVPVLLVL
jgi:hypothetical protein